MDLKDQRTIEDSRDRVYAALIDPEVLQSCIPGCTAICKISDTKFEAVVS